MVALAESVPEVELYLIRHGESAMNAHRAHLIGGRGNETPLTPTGEEQSELLGHYLAASDIIPDLIVASPAVRTVETARIVLDAMGLTVEPVIDDALQEMDRGDWVGRVRTEIYTEELIAEANKIGRSFKAPGGESMDDVSQRMFDWVTARVDSRPVLDRPEVVFVFGHGVAIRCLAARPQNWSREEIFAAETPNTSLSLMARKQGGWLLEYLGRTPHLEI